MPAKMKKRKDGRYQKWIPIGKDENDKILYTFAYGRTLKELEENVDKIKFDLNRGIDPRKKGQTFLAAAEAWLAAKEAVVEADDSDGNASEDQGETEKRVVAANVSETTYR